MSSKQLLYLEDDQVLAEVSSEAFARRGFSVAHYTSLSQVRECVHFPQFSHALLDLKLEDGYSLPLIEHLIAANQQMKIVVLTGYASLATAVQAVKMGAVNYLAKPATVDEVLQAFTDHEQEDATVPPEAETMSLRRREWEAIQAALVANDGNISATARQLKMHRRTLQRKLQKKPVSD